ncbi:MAG: hypothetical protein K0R66_1652 [Gammaproteobacteria bacterium]|jgi:hypothetical protein|nr:hypothetical protein [Gammaproteobacteria bacterium]
MFNAYKIQVAKAKCSLASLSQPHLQQCSFKGWQHKLKTYLKRTYIGADLAMPSLFSDILLLKVLNSDRSNIDTVINNLRADLTSLRDEAKLSPIQYSDKAINDIVGSCRTDPNLKHFTSRERLAAYYASILLIDCSDGNYYQFKAALKKAQGTVYFKPGIVSSRLNQRMNEGLELVEEPFSNLVKFYQLQLDAELSESKFHEACKLVVKKYAAQHPEVAQYFKLKQELSQLQSPKRIEAAELFLAKESELLKAISENKNRALAHVVLRLERPKIEKSRAILQRIDYLNKAISSFLEKLQPHVRSFCEQYGKAEDHILADLILGHSYKPILSYFQNKAQSIINQYQLAVSALISSLQPPLSQPASALFIAAANLGEECNPFGHRTSGTTPSSTASSLSMI